MGRRRRGLNGWLSSRVGSNPQSSRLQLWDEGELLNEAMHVRVQLLCRPRFKLAQTEPPVALELLLIPLQVALRVAAKDEP